MFGGMIAGSKCSTVQRCHAWQLVVYVHVIVADYEIMEALSLLLVEKKKNSKKVKHIHVNIKQ